MDKPWLLTDKLVVKPDQLIKRRGKLGLIKVNVDYPTVKAWVLERMGQDQVRPLSGLIWTEAS